MPTYYFVDYEKKGLAIVVSINDVVVGRMPDHDFGKSGSPLNMWIRPGANRVRVQGKAPADAAGARHVEITVSKQEGDDHATREVLAHLLWPRPDASVIPAAVDEVLAFVPDPVPPSELWAKAERITLDPSSTTSILTLVTELHRRIAARDLKGWYELTDFQTVDTGRSLYIPVDKARESGREFFEEAMQGKWDAEPWDPAKADLKVVADGLLVEVTEEGKLPIRVKMGTGRFQAPIYVARCAGQWIIAR